MRQLIVPFAALLLAATPSASAAQTGTAVVGDGYMRLEIPIGRLISAPWRWRDQATGDNMAEYQWEARVSDRYSVGFMLFKFPGSTPGEGSFDDLLRAGQVQVAEVTARGGRTLPSVKPTVRGDGSSLVVELTGKAVSTLFGDRPATVWFETRSPYARWKRVEVPVRYEAAKTLQGKP